MKIYKIYILFYFSFFTPFNSYNQNIISYRSCNGCTSADSNDSPNGMFTYSAQDIPYATNQIVSDYGPRRRGGDHYDWHGGIDYSSNPGDNDRGTLLVALEGGSVMLNVSTSFKYLIIDSGNRDYGYAHIFRTSITFPLISGACVLKYMDSPHENVLCIVTPILDNGGNVIDYTAIGDVNGFVTHNNIQVPVSNNINAGDFIGPMGDSNSPTDPLDVHLHLYGFSGNNFSTHDAVTKNPLENINHAQPAYDVQILDQNNNVGNITLSYPGTDNTPILIRPIMPGENSGVSVYQNSVMNVDNVKVLIKKDFQSNSAYTLINGGSQYSEISLGGRNSDNRNPLYMTQDGSASNGGGNAQSGNSNRTGIDPFAYADAASHPWDDFYYSDFFTRIHLNDNHNNSNNLYCYCPSDARYNDGRYDVKAITTDVVGSVYDSEKTEILIDNFRPYIRRVGIYINTIKVYDWGWECNDQCNGINLDLAEDYVHPILTTEDLENGMEIMVTISEPLNNLSLKIPLWQTNDILPTYVAQNKQFFSFNIPILYQLNSENEVRFEFKGKDLSGNDLINLESYSDQSCVEIPKRVSNGWEDDFPISQIGLDNTHYILFDCGTFQGCGCHLMYFCRNKNINTHDKTSQTRRRWQSYSQCESTI